MNSGINTVAARPYRAALFLVAVLVCSYAYFESGSGWNQDSHFDLTRALVEHHTVKIDSYRANTGDIASFGAHFYSNKAPGLSLLAAPVWELIRVLSRARGKDPDSTDVTRLGLYLAGLVTVALPAALALALLFLESIKMGSSVRGAVFGAVALGLSTPLWCYATLFWAHAASGAFLVFAFVAAKALQRPEYTARNQWIGLGVGLAAGWATLIEYPAAPAAFILAGYAVLNAWRGTQRAAWRAALGICCGAALCIAILATYNLAAFHSALKVSYEYQVGFSGTRQGFVGVTYPKPRVMWGLLVGLYRGLLPTAPVLLVAPLGMIALWRNGDTRRDCVVLAAIPLYYYLLNASYVYWYAGWCYGPRDLSPGLFFLAPALAMVWTAGATTLRALLLVLLAVGLSLCLVVVSTTPLPDMNWAIPVAHLAREFAAGHIPAHAGTNAGVFLTGLYGLPSLIPLLLAWLVAISMWLYMLGYKMSPTTLRTAVATFAGTVLAFGGWMAWRVYTPLAPPSGASVLVSSEYGSHRIATELRRAGVIRSEFAFRVWHALHRSPSLKAGEYLFKQPATLAQVYDRIAQGGTSPAGAAPTEALPGYWTSKPH